MHQPFVSIIALTSALVTINVNEINAKEQCDGGRLKSPCVIDGNDAIYVEDKKVAFYVNGITGELHRLTLSLHFSEGQLYFTGFTGTDTIPHVKYNGLIHQLSKIWFRFQYRMAGSEHRYVNDRILEENIGEIYMDFKQCTQENKAHHVIFASVLKQTSRRAKNFREYDDLFDQHRIFRGGKYNEMQITTELSWELFLTSDPGDAWAYNGSLPDGTCDGGVLYVIFKVPIFAKVKGNLLSYYSLSVQMARPIQGIPNKLYKYASHHFDFGYRLSNKDIESCITATAAAKQTVEETTTKGTETLTVIEKEEDIMVDVLEDAIMLFPRLFVSRAINTNGALSLHFWMVALLAYNVFM